MHYNVYDVFYSLNSHQHVSAAIEVMFRVMILFATIHMYNMVSCAAIIP